MHADSVVIMSGTANLACPMRTAPGRYSCIQKEMKGNGLSGYDSLRSTWGILQRRTQKSEELLKLYETVTEVKSDREVGLAYKKHMRLRNGIGIYESV